MTVRRWAQRLVLVAFGLGLGACDKPAEHSGAPPAPSLSSSSVAKPPARAARPAQVAQRYRFPAAARIVAVGDVHGDLAATRAALRLAGAVDREDDWVGGELVVVQTGDQLDRGDDDRAILELFEALEGKARAAGGAFHVINGNHETLNVMGDFRYVTARAMAAFSDVAPEGALAAVVGRYPRGQRGRAAAFLPGGMYARRLGRRNTIVIVGDTVFVHGGITRAHVRRGVGKINREIMRWMQGQTFRPPASVTGPDSPVWARMYSDGEPDAETCGVLAEVLSRLEVSRMVVGHTVQKRGISSGCGGRVWRIDVGMSEYYGGRVEVLEIKGSKLRVITVAAEKPD